ncbi:MAG: Crp/Fnr family transcriptional regulator [Beijerinckiaceae bacterium]
MVSLAPLDSVGWLSKQPGSLQEWAARVGSWRTYRRGQSLYQADQAPDALYGLAEGCLEVSVPLPDGEVASVYFAELGFWAGESAILSHATRTMSLTAATESRVFRIAGVRILELLERSPEFWRCFYALSHANATLAILEYARALNASNKARVCTMLLRLAKSTDKVTVTQAKIAELLGVTRSTIQRVLAELVGEGVISVSYASITVLDRTKLYRAMRS